MTVDEWALFAFHCSATGSGITQPTHDSKLLSALL